MKKIAALILAAVVIGGGAFFLLTKTQEIIYLGSFSGREAPLGNSFFRGLSFYASEANQKHFIGKLAVAGIDYEGKAENIAKILETEKARVAKEPVIIQGSDTLLKSFIDAKSLNLPAQGRIAISSDLIDSKTVPSCIAENSEIAVINDAVSFAKKNLGSKDPSVIASEKYKEFSSLKDLKHGSAESIAASPSTKDSVVLIVLPSDQVLNAMATLRAKGFKGHIVVPSALSFLDVRLQMASAAGENYLISNYSSAALEPGIRAFIDKYAQQFNEPPSQYTFLGFACAARVFQDKEIDVNALLSVKAFKIEKAGDVTIAITR